MALWAPVDHATAEGKELQALGEAFIGRHGRPSLPGLHAVLGREAGTDRGRRPRPPRWRRPPGTHRGTQLRHQVRDALRSTRPTVPGAPHTGQLRLPIQEGRPSGSAARRGDVSFEEWWAAVLRLDWDLDALQHMSATGPDPIVAASIAGRSRPTMRLAAPRRGTRIVTPPDPGTAEGRLRADRMGRRSAGTSSSTYAQALADGLDPPPTLRILAGAPSAPRPTMRPPTSSPRCSTSSACAQPPVGGSNRRRGCIRRSRPRRGKRVAATLLPPVGDVRRCWLRRNWLTSTASPTGSRPGRSGHRGEARQSRSTRR